jgi:hypothetical protein
VTAYECRIFFSDGRFIWSETYYVLASSSSAAMNLFRPVAAARGDLNGENVSIQRLRCAQVSPPGDVSVDGLAPTHFVNPSADPSLSLLVTWGSSPIQGPPIYTTHMFIRGLPLVFFDDQGLEPVAGRPIVQTGLLRLLSVLTLQGFCLKVQSRALPAFPIQNMVQIALDNADVGGTPITGVPLDAPNARIVLIGQLQGLVALLNQSAAASPKINVTGARWTLHAPADSFTVNGVSGALYWDAGSVVIQGLLPTTGYLRKPGFVRLETSVYPAISTVSIGSVTRRAVGGRSRNAGLLAPSRASVNAVTSVPPLNVFAAPDLGATVPFDQPVYADLHNAREVAAECFLGYLPPPPAQSGSIRIYEVLNYPSLWLVTLSGTSPRQDQFTGFSQDITAGLNPALPDLFLDSAFNHITALIPRDARIILHGHSLGGMECQNLQADLQAAGYEVQAIVTYGAPLTVMLHARTPTVRFWMKGDPVVLMTPLAQAILATGLLPLWYVNLDDPAYDNDFVLAHNSYDSTLLMENYTVIGQPIVAGVTPPILSVAAPSIFVPTWYYPPAP